MILGPITGIDCVAFVIFLIPQLLYQAGIFVVLPVVIRVLPFLSQQTRFLKIGKRTDLALDSFPTSIPAGT